jgi:hypothetical protein
MNLPYNTKFSKLSKMKHKEYNKNLNEYILYLGINWKEKLKSDFDETVCEEILNDSYKAEREFISAADTGREMLMTEDQRECFENIPDSERAWYQKL